MRAPLQCATSENCRQLVCPSQLTLDWNKIRCAKNVHTWTRYLCQLRSLNSKRNSCGNLWKSHQKKTTGYKCEKSHHKNLIIRSLNSKRNSCGNLRKSHHQPQGISANRNVKGGSIFVDFSRDACGSVEIRRQIASPRRRKRRGEDLRQSFTLSGLSNQSVGDDFETAYKPSH